MNDQITIFTDGASRGNPGPGGWGAIVMYPDEKNILQVAELGGSEDETTNNRMELTAAIEGLRFVESNAALREGHHTIVVRTDSRYVINGATRWVAGWQKNEWRTKAKKAVLNQDLWRELVRLTERFDVVWEYVGGHVGIAGNERADTIATAYADDQKASLVCAPLSAYPIDLTSVTRDEAKVAIKKNGASRSRMKAYSYVSKVDGVIKTHGTWDECKARVDGKNAQFRKATSAEEEARIIAEFEKRKQ